MRKKLQKRLRRDLLFIQDAVQRLADNLGHDDSYFFDFRYAQKQLETIGKYVRQSMIRMREDEEEFPEENGFGPTDESIFDADDDDDDDEPPTADIVVEPVE